MKEKHYGYLQEYDGKKSSKRLLGVITSFIGIFLGIALFVHAILHANYDIAKSVIEMFLIAGAGLLGISITGSLFQRGKK
jgi:hypothetical protein